MANVFLFDMDGLLLDTERQYQAAFCQTLEHLSLAQPSDAEFFTTLVGSSWNETEKALIDYLPPTTDLTAMMTVWHEKVVQVRAGSIPLRPTVRDVLERLRDNGARMAVVTSTKQKHVEENLSLAGIRAFFETVVAGDMVAANKPDPAPYLQAAQAMGVPAISCYAFEDSDRGIMSAIRAGCTAVQIPDLRPPNTPIPDLGQHVARDLAGAMRHLGQL